MLSHNGLLRSNLVLLRFRFGRSLKIRYNLIFKPFMCHKSFNPVFMNVYPGFITMSKEYYNGQIFIYLGDNTKIIDDELCKVTLFYE